MRATLIINPVSGDNESNERKIPRIRAGLPALEIEIACTSEEASASSLARAAVAAGVDIILVGGGDGTVSEAASELVGRECTLGILPIGTFNNIARSLSIPMDLNEACGIIAAGSTRSIDVGIAQGDTHFFEAAGVGLDAALFPLGEEIKSGRWSRILSALALAFKFRPQAIYLTFDRTIGEALPAGAKSGFSKRRLRRREIRRRALFAVAANGPYYGGGFTVAPAARLDDGLLTVTIYRRFSKWELIRHFWSISGGKRRYSPKVETYHAASVTISSPADLPVHLDGRAVGTVPLSLKVAQGALRVFVPPVQSGRSPVIQATSAALCPAS